MEYLLTGRKILVVDDNPDNLLLLERVLDQQDYQVLTADSGESALELVSRDIPDLILLDLQMPGIDGFEVCTRLKEHERTASIPVLFMSAADNIGNITRGFDLGAADFIPKPFHNLEVLARVRSHLMNKVSKDELLHMAQQKSLGYLVMGLAHEINTPLGNGITAMSVVSEEYAALESMNLPLAAQQSLMRMGEAQNIVSNSLHTLRSLVDTLNEINLDSTIEPKHPVRLIDIVDLVLSSHRRGLADLSCTVEVEVEEDLSLKIPYRVLIQILSNLIMNVVDHAFPPSSDGRQVYSSRIMKVTSHRVASNVMLRVSDTGSGIVPEIRTQLFDPFITTKRKLGKNGLGLYIVLTGVTSARGTISWESEPGKGSVFTVYLPLS